jgi:uncharacterized protein with PIN domain
MKFAADSMLGRLAKWLRVLGYDTHYRGYYGPAVINQLAREGRCLLSRQRKTVDLDHNAVLINSNHVGEQLDELKKKLHLSPDRSQWFTRCLICNVLLRKAQKDKARENVPEYIFYQNVSGIRFCPSCGRYYWSGSHRQRMVKQLEQWEF